jgi:hypothetical protein
VLIELLGGWAAAGVEVSRSQAAWQHACRTWWQRVLTRGVAAAILIAGAEYALTVIFPIAVERLSTWVFKRGAVALALPLVGFAVWALSINGAASGPALGSAIVVWLFSIGLSHTIFWPLLLLMSAGVWRDVAPLPEERWTAGSGAAAEEPAAVAATDAKPARKSRLFGRGGGGAQEAPLEQVAVVAAPAPLPPADNPFAGPAASTWNAPPPATVWGEAPPARGAASGARASGNGAW